MIRQSILLIILLFLMLSVLLFPAFVSADGISGSIELGYSLSKQRFEDSSGSVTKTDDESFGQRYILNLNKTLYPNLNFAASGTFEKIKTTSDNDGPEVETTATTKSGLLNLRLDTRIISGGLGFTRREDKLTTSSGNSLPPNFLDTYNASLAWNPEGLPSVDALFTRTDLYDKDRKVQNILTDFLSLTVKYVPLKGLDLRGSTTFTDTQDKLNDTESKITSYQGKATYTRRFGERVSMYADYNFFTSETEVTSGGAGLVSSLPFSSEGYSLTNSNDVLNEPLVLNPSFSGIDIVIPPGGDNSPRQIGLKFTILGAGPPEVNTIYVYVNNVPPPSSTFQWDVFTSATNDVTAGLPVWEQCVNCVSSTSFNNLFQRFEINLNRNVSAQFIKVVTKPFISSTERISVTLMEAIIIAPAQEVRGTQRQTSHVYDLNVKWQLLDRPNLYYNFFYWGSYFDPGGISRYVMTNSLNLSHRFNRVFSGTARIGREDSEEPEKRSANVYSASLTAVPLPTLFHSIVVSGRFQDSDLGSSNTQAVYLNNSAELYSGLHLNLSGGVSVSTDEKDRRTTSVIVNSGASIVPHPTLALNLTYSQTDSDQSGGGKPDTSSSRKFTEIAASYNPFRTLYIFASYGINDDSDREEREIVQNYTLTWSPFPDGDLQFSFAYTEFISSVDETKERAFTPSLRWYIRPNTTLDVSYTDRKNRSVPQDSDEELYFATLRIAF